MYNKPAVDKVNRLEDVCDGKCGGESKKSWKSSSELESLDRVKGK